MDKGFENIPVKRKKLEEAVLSFVDRENAADARGLLFGLKEEERNLEDRVGALLGKIKGKLGDRIRSITGLIIINRLTTKSLEQALENIIPEAGGAKDLPAKNG